MKLPAKRTMIAICAAVLLTLIFLMRGWIRSEFIPSYVNATSGRHLQRKHKELFMFLQEPVGRLGFENLQETKQPDFINRTPCGVAYFYLFTETVECNIAMNQMIVPDASFTANWLASAEEVDQVLQQYGWQNESSSTLAAMLNDPQRMDVWYVKSEGKVSCRLNFEQGTTNHSSTRAADSLEVSYGCERTVKILGGSAKLHDSGLF